MAVTIVHENYLVLSIVTVSLTHSQHDWTLSSITSNEYQKFISTAVKLVSNDLFHLSISISISVEALFTHS